MTPDDYQRMNDILIGQASENEIYIAGLLERIRDLEAQLAQEEFKSKRTMGRMILTELLFDIYPGHPFSEFFDDLEVVLEYVKNSDINEVIVDKKQSPRDYSWGRHP